MGGAQQGLTSILVIIANDHSLASIARLIN